MEQNSTTFGWVSIFFLDRGLMYVPRIRSEKESKGNSHRPNRRGLGNSGVSFCSLAARATRLGVFDTI